MARQRRPVEESPRQRAERAATTALARIEQGPDVVHTTTPWVRALASNEAREDGEFARTLTHRVEPGWGDLAREVYSGLYGLGADEVPAEIAPSGTEWQQRAIKDAFELPEWQQLMARAKGDAWATGIASAAALDVMNQQLPQLPPETVQDIEEQVQFLGDLMREKGKTSPAHLRKLGELKKRHQAAIEAAKIANEQVANAAPSIRSSLREAAQQVSEAIAEADEAATALGVGHGTASSSLTNLPRAEVLNTIRGNDKIRRIAKLAGRLKAQASRKQREKTKQERSEVADVTTGSDLARLLPSELALLADPDTELLLMARLAERGALEYELRAKAPKTEGPIIIAIDESGSMMGERDEWAKAVALTLMEIAARQNRPFVVVHFDGAVTRVDEFFTPRTTPWASILECCMHFTGGGTSIGAAMRRAVDIIETSQASRDDKRMAKADVVVITDGDDYGHNLIATQIDRARTLNASVYGVVISDHPGAGSNFLSVEGFAHTTRVATNDLAGASKKLDEVFSV